MHNQQIKHGQLTAAYIHLKARDWVICAPAAFLRCGSPFSGSLSAIPNSPAPCWQTANGISAHLDLRVDLSSRHPSARQLGLGCLCTTLPTRTSRSITTYGTFHGCRDAMSAHGSGRSCTSRSTWPHPTQFRANHVRELFRTAPGCGQLLGQVVSASLMKGNWVGWPLPGLQPWFLAFFFWASIRQHKLKNSQPKSQVRSCTELICPAGKDLHLN